MWRSRGWMHAAWVLLCLRHAVDCVIGQNASEDFRCCTPDTWKARVRSDQFSVIQGKAYYQEYWMTYYYDYKNQREAYTNSSTDGQPPIYERIVLDYKNHQWVIVVDKKMCVIYKLHGPFQRKCTPENATFVSFALAPTLTPLEGVFANTVYAKTDDVTSHVTVTVGQCALLEEASFRFLESENGTIVQTSQYFNQTLTFDPEVFSVPDYCVPAPPDGDGADPHAIAGIRNGIAV